MFAKIQSCKIAAITLSLVLTLSFSAEALAFACMDSQDEALEKCGDVCSSIDNVFDFFDCL